MLVELSDDTVAAVAAAIAYDPQWGDEWPDIVIAALDSVQRDIDAAKERAERKCPDCGHPYYGPHPADCYVIGGPGYGTDPPESASAILIERRGHGSVDL